MPAPKRRILFACTINRMRSATAHDAYRDDPRRAVRSAGTAAALLAWADAVVVMEKAHRNHTRKHFPHVYEQKPIVCLYIPDEYDYQQPALLALLRERFEDGYRRGLLG
jgi:predicted protein tyrosine phosphatase